MRAMKGIGCILIFLSVFGLCMASLPRRASSEIQHKFEQFRAGAHEYDVLFIGSSHVIFMIDPQVFDAEIAKRGYPLRSYNMAFEGMAALPANEVLSRVLAMPETNLQWVFVELKQWHPVMQPHQLYSDRHVWWHSPRATLQACRSVWAQPGEEKHRLRATGEHLYHMMLNYWPLGKAYPLLFGPPAPEYPEPGPRGFLSMEQHLAGRPQAVERFRADMGDVAKYEAAVEKVRKAVNDFAQDPEPDWAGDMQPWYGLHRDFYAQQRAAVEEAGAEIAYIYPPSVSNPRISLELSAFTGGDAVFNFCDPDRYPSLFAWDKRFEYSHLNSRGAALYSRMVADAFADYLDGRKRDSRQACLCPPPASAESRGAG